MYLIIFTPHPLRHSTPPLKLGMVAEPINEAPGCQSQKAHEFKTNLMYIVGPCLKGGERGKKGEGRRYDKIL